MVKIIKRKNASKTSKNNELPSQQNELPFQDNELPSQKNELPSQDNELIPQQTNWKTYSTVYDEIREDCRLDSLYDLGNVHSQHPDGDYLCEVEDVSEDYLDFLLGYE